MGPIEQAMKSKRGGDMSRSVMDYTPEQLDERQKGSSTMELLDLLSNLIPAKGAAGVAGAGVLKSMRAAQGGISPASVAGLLQSLGKQDASKALYGLANRDVKTAADPEFLEMFLREANVAAPAK